MGTALAETESCRIARIIEEQKNRYSKAKTGESDPIFWQHVFRVCFGQEPETEDDPRWDKLFKHM